MEPAVASYETYYHFHLLYNAILSTAGYVVVLVFSRGPVLHAPELRGRLFALIIGLPILGELVAFTAYLVRPTLHTPLRKAIARFHEQCEICTFMDEPLILSTQPYWVLSFMLLIALISLTRNELGAFVLGFLTATYPPVSVDSHPRIRRSLVGVVTRCNIPLPRIIISPCSVPLAFTIGVRRPAIIISQGMLSQFSQAELETVLTHELAHIVRRDNLWNWLIVLLRDALFFLPTSHLAWRQMLVSQEEACDDLTTKWTGRPLDLARSLVKAWQYPCPREFVLLFGLFLVTPLFRRASTVERRIERIILATYRDAGVTSPPNRILLVRGLIGLLLLLYALPIATGS